MAKPIKKFRKVLLIIGIVITGLLTATLIGGALVWNSEKLNTTKLNTLSQSATFYDCEQNVINAQNPTKYCPYDAINLDCQHAFIAVEDKNFYRHHGLSYPRIVKALTNNLAAGYSKEGASTISQQLIKNTHLNNEKTLQRKLREAILALKLEQNYSKEQILEFYLNAIYFGNNLYGIANASEFYFGKTPAELSPAESAGLAGLIKNPSKYNPLTNYENFQERAHLVLRLMYEQQYLDADSYTAALQEPLQIANHDLLWLGNTYQTLALQEAARLLKLSESDIINYGYQIETYYDPASQELLYQAINEPEYALSGEKFALLSAPNGQVRAVWTSTPTLLTARRNFGSAMKPLLVYAPALELGIVQPETLIDDSPLIDTDFNPKNSDNQYHGLVSVREALTHSYNIPAVKILNATTLDQAITVANKYGMNLSNDENLSLALGNTKQGTTFLELAGGYQTIANQGKYAPARFIRTIRDRKGETIYFDLTNKYNYAPQVLTQDTAYLLTDMLLDTARSGTARKLAVLEKDIAAKTGTTERAGSNTNTDATLVTYTPENVLILWQGNATMQPDDDLPHGTTGGGRLANVAKQIHSVISSDATNFSKPNSVKTVQLDRLDYQRGDLKIASAATPETETISALFANRYQPTTISTNYLITTPTQIDGKITDNRTAQIWFSTLPNQTYKIFKNDILQEVISNHQGTYTYLDKNPQLQSTYYVQASLPNTSPQDSNHLTLCLPQTQHTKPVTKAIEKKSVPWYF